MGRGERPPALWNNSNAALRCVVCNGTALKGSEECSERLGNGVLSFRKRPERLGGGGMGRDAISAYVRRGIAICVVCTNALSRSVAESLVLTGTRLSDLT